MRAASHPQQAERLAALRRYGVLDTPRERDFDEVVELVARHCEAPISVINLIDAERQWFKAEVGLGVRETPLETSLCSHVILEHDYVEIPDTLADPRMSDNPLCLDDEAPLRFYAGALLKTREGLPIGTLCVLDNAPRTLTPLQRETVRVMAAQVMLQMELRLALRQQEVIRRESDHRVKNSLATVASMLNMQARRSASPEARDALEDASGRIHAAAALHKELHEATTGDAVDLASFMSSIGAQLQRAAPDDVALTLAFPARTVMPHAASSIATIVNEFVSNAYKHAFPEGRAGTVRVEAREEDGGLLVTGADDGVGNGAKPRGDEAMSSGLGSVLMRAAADRIDAELDTEIDERGARFALRVPARSGVLLDQAGSAGPEPRAA